MIQVRPLQRWQMGDAHGQLVPRYGDRQYITNDGRFIIGYAESHDQYQGWRICPRGGTPWDEYHYAVYDAGLMQTTRFPRRCDAIEALEHVAAGVSDHCESDS